MSTQMSDAILSLDLRGLKIAASATNNINNLCKKDFHAIWDDGAKSMRLRYNPVVHSRFNPATQFSAVNENLQFLDFFLPAGASYGQVTVFGTTPQGLSEGTGWMDSKGRNGLWVSALQKKYRVLYGDWRDHGKMVVVPVDCGVKKLNDLGLHFTMQDQKDKPKGEKYLGRLFAHHEWAVPGKIVGEYSTPQGKVLTAQVGAIRFDVLHVDLDTLDPKPTTQEDIRLALVSKINETNALAGKSTIPLTTTKGWKVNGRFASFDKACEYYGVSLTIESGIPRNKSLVDGWGSFDLNLAHELGSKYNIPSLMRIREGMAIKATVCAKLGLGKGFYTATKGGSFGIVVFGVKKQVTFDGFFLGSLGAVKGGDAYTCIQSMGAFITRENKSFWSDLASDYMNDLNNTIHDEKKFRSFMLKHIKPADDLLDELDMNGWLLLEALRNGVPILHNPGLFRRAVRYVLTQVMNCSTKARIPYGKKARRVNVMPDPSCIDMETGAVDWRKSVIPVDCVCCMDFKEGAIAAYRQPLAHAKEAFIAKNIHDRRFRKYAGLDLMIMGQSAYEQFLQAGGGDEDDSFIVTDDLELVTIIASADYPVVKLEKSSVPATVEHPLHTNNRFMDRNRHAFPREWGMYDFFQSTVDANTQSLSIGVVDNAIRLDGYRSGEHKQNMLDFLSEEINKSVAGTPAYDALVSSYWKLHDLPEHMLRVVASNLEMVIDASKMGKEISGLSEHLGEVESIMSETPIFPMCWEYMGKGGRSKIPMARQMAKDYILLPSLVCDILAGIKLEIDKLLEALREEEWKMVQPPPASLSLSFPWDAGTADAARELRDEWRNQWSNFFDGQYKDKEKRPIELSKAYQIINDGGVVYDTEGNEIQVEGVQKMFDKWDDGIAKDEPQLRTQIASHLARMVYRTRHNNAVSNETGEFRGFNDGLLWTKGIGLYYIQSLKEAGLTGKYQPVKFDRYSQDLKDVDFEAKVCKGLVIRKSDGFEVGYVTGKLPEDGEYNVESGLLVVQEPSPELLAGATEVDESFDHPDEL